MLPNAIIMSTTDRCVCLTCTGGTVATLLSGTALILFTRFGSLGDESAVTTQKKPAKA